MEVVVAAQSSSVKEMETSREGGLGPGRGTFSGYAPEGVDRALCLLSRDEVTSPGRVAQRRDDFLQVGCALQQPPARLTGPSAFCTQTTGPWEQPLRQTVT